MSQFSIVTLATLFSAESVILGAFLGFLICGTVAIIVGKAIGKYISELMTSIITGLLCLGFSGYSLSLVISKLAS